MLEVNEAPPSPSVAAMAPTAPAPSRSSPRRRSWSIRGPAAACALGLAALMLQGCGCDTAGRDECWATYEASTKACNHVTILHKCMGLAHCCDAKMKDGRAWTDVSKELKEECPAVSATCFSARPLLRK